jgi:hypothetical protein
LYDRPSSLNRKPAWSSSALGLYVGRNRSNADWVFKVKGQELTFRVYGLGLKVKGTYCRLEGFGFRV